MQKKKRQKRLPKKGSQLAMLAKQSLAYGGELRKTRKGRQGCRPLSTKDTIHLVLRSSKAKGDWSFAKATHRRKIDALIKKFSDKYYVKIISYANVGNHLHLHIKLFKRHLYTPFIRALTASIMMAVTGASRWQRNVMTKPGDTNLQISSRSGESKTNKFWDYRPYTRIVRSYRAFLTMRDYIEINLWEGFGEGRFNAMEHVRRGRWRGSTA